MGITDLNTLLKREAPSSQTVIRLDKFAGKRIAIDATCLAYRLMSRSNKINISSLNVRLNPSFSNENFQRDSDWYRHFIELAKTLTSFGIVPIFVFDGKSVPDKEATKEERKEEKRKLMIRRKELEERLESVPVSQRSDSEIAELVSLKKNIVFVTTELTNNIKNILNLLGFPVISANGEAEKTCVSMAIDGLVAGVYSPDTDCIAMGCPITLTGIVGGKGIANLAFNAVIYDRVIKETGLKPHEFLDLCILAGSDFSRNIKGYRILNVFKLMKKLPPDVPKTVENVIPLMNQKSISDESLKTLNHEKCRSCLIFGYVNTLGTLDQRVHETIPSLDINTKSVYENGVEDILDSFGVGDLYTIIRASLRNINPKINYNGGSELILDEGRVVSMVGNKRIVILNSQLANNKSNSGTDSSGSDSDSSQESSSSKGKYTPPHQRIKIPDNCTKPDLDFICKPEHHKRPAKPAIVFE